MLKYLNANEQFSPQEMIAIMKQSFLGVMGTYPVNDKFYRINQATGVRSFLPLLHSLCRNVNETRLLPGQPHPAIVFLRHIQITHAEDLPNAFYALTKQADSSKFTPLHYTVQYGNLGCAFTALLGYINAHFSGERRQIILNTVDREGLTPFGRAVKVENWNAAFSLIGVFGDFFELASLFDSNTPELKSGVSEAAALQLCKASPKRFTIGSRIRRGIVADRFTVPIHINCALVSENYTLLLAFIRHYFESDLQKHDLTHHARMAIKDKIELFCLFSQTYHTKRREGAIEQKLWECTEYLLKMSHEEGWNALIPQEYLEKANGGSVDKNEKPLAPHTDRKRERPPVVDLTGEENTSSDEESAAASSLPAPKRPCAQAVILKETPLENIALKDRLESLRNKHQSQVQDYEAVSQQLAETAQAQEELKAELREARKKCAAYEDLRGRYEAQVVEIERLEKGLSATEATLKKVRPEYKQLERDKIKLEKALAEGQAELTRSMEDLVGLSEMKGRLEEENAALKVQLGVHQAKMEKLEQENAATKTRLEALQNFLTTMQTGMQSLVSGQGEDTAVQAQQGTAASNSGGLFSRPIKTEGNEAQRPGRRPA